MPRARACIMRAGASQRLRRGDTEDLNRGNLTEMPGGQSPPGQERVCGGGWRLSPGGIGETVRRGDARSGGRETETRRRGQMVRFAWAKPPGGRRGAPRRRRSPVAGVAVRPLPPELRRPPLPAP